jgi:glyoxylase I family protein
VVGLDKLRAFAAHVRRAAERGSIPRRFEAKLHCQPVVKRFTRIPQGSLTSVAFPEGRSVAFYTQHLGFKLEHQKLPAFANVSLGDVQILLSGPGASGSRPMPDGQSQEPGGWNRVVLRVSDLSAAIDAFKSAGVRFRNEMETGPGGRQIQIEDPDGNPIELFEPAR